MNDIKSMLEDNSGGTSSIRVGMLIWIVGVFIIWATVSLYTFTLVPIPESVITILGIVTGLKTIQRFGEKTDTDTPVK